MISPLALVAVAALTCTGSDEHGHPFSTCFDPWRGLELGGAFVVDRGALGGAFNTGIRLRGERESRSKTDSTWLSLHNLAATWVRPVDANIAVQFTGYEGLFRRHVREGVLLLPLNPPVQIPFPLDISIHASALKYERRLSEGDDWSFEPLRVSVLFDPLRSASSRFHLGVGVTAAYRVRQVSREVLHEVAPLTAGTVVFNFESEDGLWFARGSVTAGASFVAPTPTFTFRARGEVELARVLVAVVDQPVFVFVRGSGAWRDAGAREGSEWSAQVGLAVRLFSAR